VADLQILLVLFAHLSVPQEKADPLIIFLTM